jgi:hypothetical protein
VLVGVPHLQTKKNKKRLKLAQNVYCGVYIHKGCDGDGNKWYFRGRLRHLPDDARPLLLVGESVKYRPGQKAEVEELEWNDAKNMHVQVSSAKDKARCSECGMLGEKELASQLRHQQQEITHRSKKRSINASYKFRPLQPVYAIGLGKATIIEPPVDGQHAKVECDRQIITVSGAKLRLLGHKPEPIDLDQFFETIKLDLPPKQAESYAKPADYLLTEWRKANKELACRLEKEFEDHVMERQSKRELASETGSNRKVFSRVAYSRLQRRAEKLLQRLQEDYNDPLCATQMPSADFNQKIVEIKNTLPNPNLLLLCGGMAPEVTAYKRLRIAPLGGVILQDTDIHAVGVAVAAHPDVHFYLVCDDPQKKNPKQPGDVQILSVVKNVIREIEIKLGGIHHISITNPCQSFSLAGKKDGFDTASGQLLWDCCTVVRGFETSSTMPSYLVENVPSTIDTNERFNAYLPHRDANFFYACASMCSPCLRKRKFATNRPPGLCLEGPRFPSGPPSLNGDLFEVTAQAVVQGSLNRRVHPELKKLPCLIHSGATRHTHIWEIHDPYKNPKPTPMSPTEAEIAMGYTGNELGITAKLSEKAVQERIKAHCFETDGCLISLKGCACDEKFPAEPVAAKRRLELLGNSEAVTLLEALMWSDRKLYPAVDDNLSQNVDQAVAECRLPADSSAVSWPGSLGTSSWQLEDI